MQPEQPAQTPTQTPMSQPQVSNPGAKNRGGMGHKLIMTLVVLLLLAAGAAGGWYYRDTQAKKDLTAKDDTISSLQAKNAQLTTDLAAAEKTPSTTAPASKQPDAATLSSIQAAITSGNTAALEGYMGANVNFVVTGSAAVPETAAKAVSDTTANIKSATTPWNFALTAATLTKYQAGTYKQYFPTTALVGQSANNYVISFQFDANGKINGVFITNSAASL